MKIRKIVFSCLVFILVIFVGLSGYIVYSNERIRHQRKVVYKNLSDEILVNVGKFPGEVGLYIKDLQTGVEIKYNENEPFPSASLVKIPLMAAVFEAVDTGNLDFDTEIKLTWKHKSRGSGILKKYRTGRKYTVKQLVELMIIESDNTATNMVTEQLGFSYINWLFKNRLGLEVTNFDRKIMELRKRKRGIENYTTAKEIADLLERIYYGKLIDKKSSEGMLSILTKQKVNDRIPKFLPSDLVIAHKTGMMRDICHDAGIIFTPTGDFILCVLTSEIRNVRSAKKFISNVAYKTYQCY